MPTAKQGLLPTRGWERMLDISEHSSFAGQVWVFPEADLGHSLSFTPTAARSVLSPSQGHLSQMTVALLSKVLFVISSLHHLRPGSPTETIANVHSYA